MSRATEDKIHSDSSTSNGGEDNADENTHLPNRRSERDTGPTTEQCQLSETDADVLKTDSSEDESAGAGSSGLQSQTVQHTTSQNTRTSALASSRPISGSSGTTGGGGGVDCISVGGGVGTINAVKSGLNAPDPLRRNEVPADDNDNINLPSGNTVGPSALTSAFEFIHRLKECQPEIYEQFLVIMDGFKYGRMCAEETMRRACHIFREHTEFIPGFNMFLPPGYEIVIQYNDQGIPELNISLPSPDEPPLYNTHIPTAPEIRRQQIQQYEQWLRSRRTSNNTSSLANGNLGASSSEPLSASEGIAGSGIGPAPAPSLDGITIYVLTSNFIAADLCRQKNPPTCGQQSQNACRYLKQAQHRYRDDMETYYTFLDIMRQFRSRRLNFPDVVRSLCYLFKEYTVLIYNFNIFLQPGHGIEIFCNQGTSVALVWMPSPSGRVSCVKAYKIPKIAPIETSPSNLHNTVSPQQQQSAADTIIQNHDHSSPNRERSISQSETIAGSSASSRKTDLNIQGHNLHQTTEADQLSEQNEKIEKQNQSDEINPEIGDDNNVSEVEEIIDHDSNITPPVKKQRGRSNNNTSDSILLDEATKTIREMSALAGKCSNSDKATDDAFDTFGKYIASEIVLECSRSTQPCL